MRKATMSKKEKCPPCRKTSIGGQALIEGIMMRGPEKSAMAVRRPNGEIFFEEEVIVNKKRPAFCRWPVVRGVFGFIDSMAMGYKALMRSSEIFVEETPEEAEAKPSDAPATEQKEPQSAFSKGTMTAVAVLSMILALAVVVVLLKWLPAFLYSKLELIMPESWVGNRWLRSAFEGVFKVLVMVGYMSLMLLMKDIRRTFMYHGAEHKTIFCYEHGQPLTVENVKKERRFHPRCGTSFIILMMLVSILVGFLIPAEFEGVSPGLYTVIRAAIGLLLVPLNMGIGYELLKLAGRHDNLLTRIISAPGVWLQHITVWEPTEDMIECAIKAFVAVIPEGERETEPQAEQKNNEA